MITELTKLPRDKNNYLASFAQKRMWFLSKLNGDNSPYHVPMALAFDSNLETGFLKKCLQAITEKHEILRTNFKEENGELVQLVQQKVDITLESVTFPVDQLDWLESAKDYLHAHLLHTFNLETGPLFITRIIQLNDATILLIVFHHIIIDEWSIGLLAQEICQYYQQGMLGLGDKMLQYIDYAAWQSTLIDEGILQKQFAFWKDKFKTIPDPLDLPYDYSRSKNNSFKGSAYYFTIPKEIKTKLAKITTDSKSTLFIVLFSIYQILLMRYTGQLDISIGIPVANRRHLTLNTMLGLFVNTIVLRQILQSQASFLIHLQATREICLDAFDNQDVPLEKVLQLLKLERISNYSPLFQAFFNYSADTQTAIKLGPYHAQIIELPILTAKFDLSLYIKNSNEELECYFEYSAELFSEETIASMATHFLQLMTHIVSSPQTVISQLKMLTHSELTTLS